MSDTVLSVKNLVKKYGPFTAVDHISFDIPRGQIVGFLGPNGAGKTTTIQMLLGITFHDGGTIEYFGKQFPKFGPQILQRINYASAFNSLLGKITAYQNLQVFAELYQIPNPKKKIDELIEYFEMGDYVKVNYSDLSAGQRTRINLAKCLINDPEVILMDEPTASLDPDIADKTLSLIESLKKEKNLTLLYTSHDMHEITRICDDVIFLDHGKIVARDTPLNLTKRIASAQLQLMFDGSQTKMKEYLKEHDQRFTFPTENTVIIDTAEKEIPKLIFGISKTDIWVTDIEIRKPTLEDVFLQIARKENDLT